MKKKQVTLLILFICGLFFPAIYQAFGSMVAAIYCLGFIALMVPKIAFNDELPGPARLVIVVTLIYGLAPMIDIAFLSKISRITEELYFEEMLPMLATYVFGILLACSFDKNRTEKITLGWGRPRLPKDIGVNATAITLLFLMALALLISGISKYGTVIGGFSREDVYQNNNLWIQILNCGIAVGVMYFSIFLAPFKWDQLKNKLLMLIVWIFSITVMGFVDLGLLGDRRIFLSMLLAIVVYGKVGRVSVIKFVSLLALLFTLWMYSFLRNSPYYEWFEIIERLDWEIVFNPANGELGAWTRIAQDILSVDFAEIFRPTFITSPVSVIPSALYPDRPLGSAVWYVSKFDPEVASVGGGWAFCLPLEGYLNFWVFGPFLAGVIVSKIISLMSRSRDYGMVAAFIFTFSFRSDLVSIIQLLGWSFLFLWLYKVFSYAESDRGTVASA